MVTLNAHPFRVNLSVALDVRTTRIYNSDDIPMIEQRNEVLIPTRIDDFESV